MMSGYISDCLGENFSCIQPKPILPQKFNWDVFMATLIPTEGCNFQCSYCHKNHPAASMTRDTLDQIEEYITAQAPRHKQVVLAWLGGEPILCKDTVLEVSEMIQNLQKQHGFQYTAKMTTNGYLLDEKLFRQFCQAGITSYQITLDGWNHDKTRPHVSGKGTLRTIIDNLVALSKLPPEEAPTICHPFTRILKRCWLRSILHIWIKSGCCVIIKCTVSPVQIVLYSGPTGKLENVLRLLTVLNPS